MADLHTLVILTDLPSQNNAVRFVFRSVDRARSIYDVIAKAMSHRVRGADSVTTVVVEDDFGRHADVDIARIAVAQVNDVGRELEAEIELQLIQSRANQKLQQRAAQDPMLRGGQIIQAPAGVLGPNGPVRN